MKKLTTSHESTSPMKDKEVIKKLGELIDNSTDVLNRMKDTNGEDSKNYQARKDNHWTISQAWIILQTYNNDMQKMNDLFEKYGVRDDVTNENAVEMVHELKTMLHP